MKFKTSGSIFSGLPTKYAGCIVDVHSFSDDITNSVNLDFADDATYIIRGARLFITGACMILHGYWGDDTAVRVKLILYAVDQSERMTCDVARNATNR